MIIGSTGGSGTSDHGALTGLSDDDHSQYLLIDGTRAMTGDLSFQNFKAIAMVCDNGATLPTSGITKGQWFLHTPTGRTVLCMYNGSSWTNILSLGSYTTYVHSTGTNSGDKGTATGTSAFQTIVYALSQLPVLMEQAPTINLSSETFTENITIPIPYMLDGGLISIEGQLTDDLSTTITGGANTVYASGGSGGTKGYAEKTAAGWTVNAYQNKLLGFATGDYAPIVTNTATRLEHAGNSAYIPTPANGQTVKVHGWGSVITSSTDKTITMQPTSRLRLKNVKVTNTAAGGVARAIWGENWCFLKTYNCYVEGDGNFGAVHLLAYSRHLTIASIFVGDGSVERLESAELFARNFEAYDGDANIWYLKGTTWSYKTCIFAVNNSTIFLLDYSINGINKPAGSIGLWVIDESGGLPLAGFIENIETGLKPQYFSALRDAGQNQFNNVTTNKSGSATDPSYCP